ncbi:MAG: endonuclease/exonuclease/phosphatase family protein [Cyclobacteriaceae bacterium]|nr:endonuclease/exonuclease/phosphatase family protein [Cyclobacteriaceae bacterium]
MKQITVFFSVFLMLSCSGKRETETSKATAMRLITYNVWYGFTLVPDRKNMYLGWMQGQNPDVVSLQELNEYTPEKLAADARQWGHDYSVLLKEEGFPTGITSRYPIEDVQRFREGHHHGVIRARIRGIYFYVIHLHPSNWETRGREIDLILEDIRGLPQESRIILAGDFNTFSPVDSAYYAHGRLEPFFQDRDVANNEKNLKEGKLDYSVIQKLMDNGFLDLEYRLRPENYSFTGSFPSRIEKEGEHGDQRRLDYVFVSRNLEDRVISAEIINNDTTWILSDHLPVRVDFRLE